MTQYRWPRQLCTGTGSCTRQGNWSAQTKALVCGGELPIDTALAEVAGTGLDPTITWWASPEACA